MNALVRAGNISKTFVLAEHGGGPVSLLAALQAGKRETKYREVRALQNVSFEIREGERVGIIGRNGAGKTTLLSILSGITEATSGTVEVQGDVHAMLTIGAVLREEATGRENIRLDGAIHGKSTEEIDAHIAEIIAFSELQEFIDRPVRTYSSGMKSRLAFSMGAFVNPDILIVDETLSVGDVFFSQKALQRMKEITRQGRIVIVVSHALGLIDDMCTRCLWLDQGRLVMDDRARDVTRAYQAAVEQADEAELARKFGKAAAGANRGEAGRLTALVLSQSGLPIAATAQAFNPLSLSIAGELARTDGAADLELAMMRVDGRPILRQKLSAHGERLPASGPFKVTVDFDPMILGANLYRAEVVLLDRAGAIDALHAVVEVIDEQGQFGGKPLLYDPPQITARPVGDIKP
jgi:lipopolysaccharide transport system ATP-binding protein